MQNAANESRPLPRNHILIVGLILYACSFAVLLRNKSFDATGAIVVLVVFGIAFPLIAWLTTRRAIPLPISVKTSKFELTLLIGYIIVLSLYLVDGPQWIDRHLPSDWIDSERVKFFTTLARKLSIRLRLSNSGFRDSARWLACLVS
jgi:hypothetical protein